MSSPSKRKFQSLVLDKSCSNSQIDVQRKENKTVEYKDDDGSGKIRVIALLSKS